MRGLETLVVTAGAAAGRTIALDGEVVLGREAEGPGKIEGDPDVSRRHARVTRDESGKLVIEDLQSTNGTFVNGVRLTAPQALAGKDVIQVGHTLLEVQAAEQPGAAELPERPAEKAEPAEQKAEPAAPKAEPRRAKAKAAQRDKPPPEKAEPAEKPDAAEAPAAPVEQVGSAPPPKSEHAEKVVSQVTLAPPAALLHGGERVAIPPSGLTLGRTDENDVVLHDDLVSRKHARIVAEGGRYYLADLGSTNGTSLNGERLVHESRWLRPGDTISVGLATMRFLSGQETRLGELQTIDVEPEARTVRFDKERVTFGRDESNDAVLDNPSISRFHAEVVKVGDRVELRDLGSRNGTRLNGHLVTSAAVEVGDEIGVGPYRFVFDGDEFIQRDDGGALRLEGVDITVRIKKDKVILDRASLSVLPGEFVVVIGESGSGKSTMIKALAGVTEPTTGVITVNGDPVRSRMPEIGYVPQFEITHGRLTVLESLRYSARLRLPQDAMPADVEQAVARVVEEVALGEHANTRIDSLSGGQRKRVSVATELVNRPGLLFLDEPTTGLDPGLETQMMKLFRKLAEVGKRAVIVVTHATKNLGLADRIAVMGRGGHLCFVGTPDEALKFFGVEEYDAIYDKLLERPGTEWRAEFEQTRRTPPEAAAAAAQAVPAGAQMPRRRHRTQPWPHAKILASRYFKTFIRDRKNVAILLLQVPLLAAAAGALFSDAFKPGKVAESVNMLFVLVTMAIWFGALDSIREVIKERPAVERESAVGVRAISYVASKAAVLFGLVSVQVFLLWLIADSMRPLHESAGRHLLLLVTLLLTGIAAISMGLLISSAVRTQEQATAFLPLAMIVQLLFAGAIVTTAKMGALGWISALVFSRWSLASSGWIAHMNERIDRLEKIGHKTDFPHSFFALPAPAGWAILLAFLVAMLGGMWLLLRRLEPR